MQVTAELRWFWNSKHDTLQAWFCDEDVHGVLAGGGQIRVDSYLREPRQVELGLKHRGGKSGVEVKGLVSKRLDDCDVTPFNGSIELWSKWTSDTLILDMAKTVTVEKRRWIRKFDTTSSDKTVEIGLDHRESPIHLSAFPDRGCSVEYTEIRFLDYKTNQVLPDSKSWWTLSFESWGNLFTVKDSLCQAAALIASRNPPEFDTSFRASYPTFLSMHAPQTVLSGSHRI